jgi:fatty-acyl-CoA synthase
MTDVTNAPAQTAGWRGKFAGFALALAIFSILWFAAAAVGTKLGLWNWQFGLGVMIGNIATGFGRFVIGVAVITSVLAVVISLVASPRKQPFMLALAAVLISGLLGFRWFGFQLNALRLPPLHDIQTDWSAPIMPSDDLIKAREATGALNPIEADPVVPDAEGIKQNWPSAAGRRVAEVQEEAEFDTATHKSPKETPYPLIAPLTAPGTVEAAYEAAFAAVEGRGWTVVTASPEDGTIEATETSFWFGFHDDVMIRILSAEDEVVIDVRSTSRVGLSDLGANAKRIRNLLDEIETRLGKGA